MAPGAYSGSTSLLRLAGGWRRVDMVGASGKELAERHSDP